MIVDFICCRSDIFYISGAGVDVEEGDLVIVKADRGTDLGCVQHAHVSWEAAQKYEANMQHNTYVLCAWLLLHHRVPTNDRFIFCRDGRVVCDCRSRSRH